MAASLSQKRDESVDCTMEFARTLRIHETLTIIIKDNISLTKTARSLLRAKRKRRGFPRRLVFFGLIFDQRSSWSTLCSDWLASASAETAIDWRVDSAWLLAASSFGSASVRLDAPVCSTLIRFLLKSWRISTIDRFEPSEDASERSVLLAAVSCVKTPLAELLSRKSVAVVRVERPSPASLRVTPVMESFDAPVSSNTRLRVSPFSRLMPLNEESCAVVLICCSTLLYCATRPARVACDVGSATGAVAVRPLNTVAVPPIVPIVDDAALFEVTMLIWPVVLMLACKLFAASAVLSALSVEICPGPVPKVMLVAVPPPVAPIVSVSPLNGGGVRLVVVAERPKDPSALVPPAAMTRFCDVPVFRTSWPVPLTVEAVVAPVMPSIAESTVCTVSVLPAPTPIVTLPLPSVVTVVCAVLKVMLLPSTR